MFAEVITVNEVTLGWGWALKQHQCPYKRKEKEGLRQERRDTEGGHMEVEAGTRAVRP